MLLSCWIPVLILKLFKHLTQYLDDLLNIDNSYFEGKVGQMYPPELQLNKAIASDTDSRFLFSFLYFKRVCFILNL